MQLNSKIGIGTVQFGVDYGISNTKGKTSEDQVKKILSFAKQNDIKVIDTASAYGNAESVLGENDLGNFKVISKFMPPSTKAGIAVQLEQSLQKLNLSSLYAYLAHRPTELINHPEQWEELTDLKKKGKIEKIGYSLNHTDELKQLLNVEMIPDLIQVPFNYFDNRFKDSMKELKKNGCEIHTRSTFLQGLFFCHPDTLSDYFNDIKPLLKRLQQQSDLAQRLLQYVLEQNFIDVVNIGVNDVEQLKQNVEGLEGDKKNTLPKLGTRISEKMIMPSEWPKT